MACFRLLVVRTVSPVRLYLRLLIGGKLARTVGHCSIRVCSRDSDL